MERWRDTIRVGCRWTLRSVGLALLGLGMGVGHAGCSTPVNPSFALTVDDAKSALRSMHDDPVPLERPVVIVGGFGDPGFATSALERSISKRVDDDRIEGVAFTDEATFLACRERLIQHVGDRFGRDAIGNTIEVDVVANSMGGLIAAHAAEAIEDEGRLRVATLYTISTPFLGAATADRLPVNELARDMQTDSAFIARIESAVASRDYAIVPYVRLDDWWVGAANTAPPGEIPFWLPNRPFEPAHMAAYTDPRIQADVLRRLRGEPPFTVEPRTPLPDGG